MNRIGSWLVLSFRLHRWEVLASAAGTALLAMGMLWFASQLRALSASEPGCPDPAAYVAGCEQFVQRFTELSDWGRQLLLVSWGTPFGMGLVLGVPLVAREVEHRTAGMAWTLSRSRAVWLAQRVAFLALVLIGLLAVLAVVSDILASAALPTQTLDSDFTWYGRRGGLIVLRGVLSLGIGVLAGAVIGRLLPGMLVAAFASVLVFTALSLGMDRWNASEAVAVPYGNAEPGALSLGQRVELTSGEIVGSAYLASLDNIVIDGDGAVYSRFDDETGLPDRSSLVGYELELFLSGERYAQVVVRESAVAGGIAVLAMLAAAAIVRRRRPG
jgi:hypothetical protein